ncbi:MAG TPA: sugar nucleotide-binding protein [Candidatus Sabulitectum sp.]|nr:sugar nucleotide-binding protein [Candidatus Sabulitectum sp.]
MRRFFLTGATGRLGTVIRSLASENWEILAERTDLRSSPPESVFPGETDHCINCAALSSRGGCAADPFSAFALNSRWPARLASYCREHGKRLIHLSTDLVYSGGIPPYTETSPAVPKSLYGWTKLLGDRAVLRLNPEALVARTSVLVGIAGAKNPTFSEDIIEGRATTFHVDCFRNHTDIRLLAGFLLTELTSSRSGLILAAAPYSMSRAAYASSILGCDIKMIPAPPHLSGDLTLRPSASLTNN